MHENLLWRKIYTNYANHSGQSFFKLVINCVLENEKEEIQAS